jgi:hypothetical protein
MRNRSGEGMLTKCDRAQRRGTHMTLEGLAGRRGKGIAVKAGTSVLWRSQE